VNTCEIRDRLGEIDHADTAGLRDLLLALAERVLDLEAATQRAERAAIGAADTASRLLLGGGNP
jgi:hypothetical protein